MWLPASSYTVFARAVRYLHLFSERFDGSLPDRYALPEPVDPVRFETRIAYRF
jgi:hypothetical protein